MTPDATARPSVRTARRELIKRHHPDRGGDAELFVRLLDDFDAGTGPSAVSSPGRTRRRRVLVRNLRARLPRHTPGRRRYATY